MALIQRFSTELSTHAAVNRQGQDEKQSVEKVIHDVSAIKRQDEDEKRYLHSLNDRLEDLLRGLDDLEKANFKLRDDLNALISNWGVGGENRVRFLQELDEIIRRLGEQNRRKVTFQAEAKIFDEQIELVDRVAVVFIDVLNMYRDKCQILFELTNELEEELRKIRLRLEISNNQVKSHDDDYQKELAKFRSYLAEWSQLALDKQYLLNEIQSLRERYNLRLAYNQEEINEWQRLLNRISQESKHYYRDYLDTIKQQIQMDYEQMAKDQQMDIEVHLQSRLKEIQSKIHMGLPLDENDERRRREETHRFESRLDESTKDYDRLQNEYRQMAEEMQRKRRLLKDLENELRNKARKNAEQRSRLEHDTDLTRAEYYALKDELDQLAYTLRFSVEEELKIYEALLNSLNRRKDDRPKTDDSRYRQIASTATHYTDSSREVNDRFDYRKSQPNLTETTHTYTTEHRPMPSLRETSTTHHLVDSTIGGGSSFGYQRSQPNLTETTHTYTTEHRPAPSLRETSTTHHLVDSTIGGGDSFAFRKSQPNLTETTRTYTTEYRPPPSVRETSTTHHLVDNTIGGGDSFGYQRSQPNVTETTRTYSSEYRPSPSVRETSTTHHLVDSNIGGGASFGFQRSQPNLTETTRTFTTQSNLDDLSKYRSTPFLGETTTTKTTKQSSETIPSIRLNETEPSSNRWTYETISSGTTSSVHGENSDRDRSVERRTIPSRSATDLYGVQQSSLDQNQTTTTTRTTRRFGHSTPGQGDSSGRTTQVMSVDVPELDEKFLKSKIHITRKYKGNILIKFVDVNARFVEVENTGNQARDLTGWYIERTVDGQRIEYTFPTYELAAHRTVRIYGNYHQRTSSTMDDQHLQLIAPNFYDWGNGRQMRTELFNRDDVGKALFEQTIKD